MTWGSSGGTLGFDQLGFAFAPPNLRELVQEFLKICLDSGGKTIQNKKAVKITLRGDGSANLNQYFCYA